MSIRHPLMLGMATIVMSCSTPSAHQIPTPKAQRELANALAGRTPGPARRCIPNYRSNQMEVIDDYTILFRDGATIYLQKPRGGCTGLANGSRTLVTRKFGSTDICDGEINHLVDVASRIQTGTCVFGPFVPYIRR